MSGGVEARLRDDEEGVDVEAVMGESLADGAERAHVIVLHEQDSQR